MTLGRLKLILSERKLRPNKKLGQNFLYDPNMIARILRTVNAGPEEVVIEVGPGMGALTEGLLRSGGEIWGIELDRGFSEFLKERFGRFGNFHLVHGDILEWEMEEERTGKKFVLVGNIPYQISSPLLEWIIGNRHRISRAFITVQAEFARRMTAQPGTRQASSFSCFVQMYAKPEIFFKIPRTVFYPPPEVDSAFVGITFYKEPVIETSNEPFLHRLIRAGFSQRRKTLANVTAKELGISRSKVEQALASISLAADVRGERLTLEQWGRLSRYLERQETS